MVKVRKNKGKKKAPAAAEEAAAAAATAERLPEAAAKMPPVGRPVPSFSSLRPSKNIEKKKRVGGSDAVTVVPTGGLPYAVAAANTPAANNKSEQKAEKSSGFIFMCSSRTKPECYRHGVFGMPKGKAEFVKRIRPETRLFLYDIDLKLMYGVYRAASQGGMNLVPGAFSGAFPAQVKFKIDKDCLPVPESTFKQAILENYNSNDKFEPDLNSKQVHKLVALFQPINTAPQTATPKFVPPPAHLPQPAEPYRAEQIPRAYLPPPKDLYRPSALQAPSHVPPPEDPYRSYAHPVPSHLPPPEDPYRSYAHPVPSRLPPPEDPYRPSAFQAPSHVPPPEDPYRSYAHPVPSHLPPPEDPYRSYAHPVASHLPPPEDPYRSYAHPVPSHLPPPEDPYRSYAHPAPSHLLPPEDPYRLSTYQAPSQLTPLEDPYRSRGHLAPVHLPTLEEKYLGRAPASSDSRYISAHAPPTANDPYYPVEHNARAPLSVAQATDPYYRPSSGYVYQHAEPARAHYPENPIPYERLGYRGHSDIIGDPNAAVKERDYPSLLRREGDVLPRAARVDESHVGSTSTYERPPLSSYLVQHYDLPVYVQGYTTTVQRQPSGTMPVSSRYSFAGGAAPVPR